MVALGWCCSSYYCVGCHGLFSEIVYYLRSSAEGSLHLWGLYTFCPPPRAREDEESEDGATSTSAAERESEDGTNPASSAGTEARVRGDKEDGSNTHGFISRRAVVNEPKNGFFGTSFNGDCSYVSPMLQNCVGGGTNESPVIAAGKLKKKKDDNSAKKKKKKEKKKDSSVPAKKKKNNPSSKDNPAKKRKIEMIERERQHESKRVKTDNDDTWYLCQIIPQSAKRQCGQRGCKSFAMSTWRCSGTGGDVWDGCLKHSEEYYEKCPDNPLEYAEGGSFDPKNVYIDCSKRYRCSEGQCNFRVCPKCYEDEANKVKESGRRSRRSRPDASKTNKKGSCHDDWNFLKDDESKAGGYFTQSVLLAIPQCSVCHFYFKPSNIQM